MAGSTLARALLLLGYAMLTFATYEAAKGALALA